MPHYFFDISVNGEFTPDDTGVSFASPEQASREAMNALYAIAHDDISKDGDLQAYTVMMNDEDGKSVYSATLSFAGAWLSRDQ